MNPSHKLSKLANRQRRLERVHVNLHKDLGNKLEPAEATYHATSSHALPKGNLLLVAHIQQISSDSTNVTRVLRAITESTLTVA